MKKISKLFALALLALPLVSCGKNTEGQNTNNDEPIPVKPWNDESSIKLEAMSGSIALGETYQIKATASSALTYSSSNEEVATVDGNGLISSVSEGDVAIKVSSSDDFIYFRLHIGQAVGPAVGGIPSLYLANGDLTLYIGETYRLNPKLFVDDKEFPLASFTYEVSNNSVISATDGVISSLAGGTSSLTVTGSYEGVTASKTFNVNVSNDITYLVPDFETRQVVTGTPLTLSFVLVNNSRIIAEGVSNTTYIVDNEDMAFIQDSQIFAIHKGKVTVTAKVTYSGKEYSCDVDITTRELYKVTYTTNGTKVFEEYVISGNCITYDVIPTKKDSIFKCWGCGSDLVYKDTPINYPMDLVAKWLVYSSDVNSEQTALLWDYSTGDEIVCDNGAGSYLWEDFQYPDTHINVGMTKKTLENTRITLPRFEYSVFPAISFYFYMQIHNTKFGYGNYMSPIIEYAQKVQVSIVGSKLLFNGIDTGETVDDNILNAVEPLTITINAPTSNTGKMCITGFYCHLSEN